jgi:carboxymethylenebutenolidase
VVHENRGLTDHIRDVTRRLAKAGHLALAVDLASRAGGTAKAGDGVTAALTNGSPADRVADLDAGFAHLRAQSDFNGKLGITGFCFGGGVTLLYAGSQPAVLAAVPYYGTPPSPISVLQGAKAAFLVHYGATDSRVTSTRGDLEAALAGKAVEVMVHEGAGHAFNNDTGGAYNEAAAVAAWTRTLAWFATYLK